jgi:predicted nucleotidyltransferase
MAQIQIELIKKQIAKLDEDDFNLSGWKSSTIVILGRIFGDTYQGIKAIENIKYSSGGITTAQSSHHWDNMKSCKKQGKDILEACITELETFGQPDKKENSKSDININLTQNQNQTVNINLLISALEDELTVSQFREVNDLMKSDDIKSEKRKKIIDKIKSFGSDIASNILANILTNPNIWG